MKKIFSLVYIIIFFLASCKKQETTKPKETFRVTYVFTSQAPAYYIAISDVTNIHDFTDSIFTPSFSKTITYDYKATYRCELSNRGGQVSDKSISITLNGNTITSTDTLYPSLSAFINP